MSPVWVFLLLFGPSLVSSLLIHQSVTVEAGEDVTLPCPGPSGGHGADFRWTRTDVLSHYMSLFGGVDVQITNSHRYALGGRLKLRDVSSLKNGDFSVTLHNVHFLDRGTYECGIRRPGRRGGQVRCSIELRVTERTAVYAAFLVTQRDEDAETDTAHGLLGQLGLLAVVVVLGIFYHVAKYLKSVRDSKRGSLQASRELSQSKSIIAQF